jgi:KTSC domain-containing protein
MPSSVIADIKYEAEHARLTVTFTTGRIYEYFMVPADIAAQFRSAFSKGSFFNTRIRDKYTCREIRPAAPYRNRSAR